MFEPKTPCFGRKVAATGVVVEEGGGRRWWWFWRVTWRPSLSMTVSCAPNYGGRVPVDTAHVPAPVCRALKITPSAHREHDELQLRASAFDRRPARKLHTSGHVNILAKNCTSRAVPKLPEVWVNRTVRASGITTLCQRAATVGSRREPPQPEPEKPARPA